MMLSSRSRDWRCGLVAPLGTEHGPQDVDPAPDEGEQCEQFGLVIGNPPRQQPPAPLVEHHAMVMPLADVRTSPDAAHSVSGSSMNMSRRRPRWRGPAQRSNLPGSGFPRGRSCSSATTPAAMTPSSGGSVRANGSSASSCERSGSGTLEENRSAGSSRRRTVSCDHHDVGAPFGRGAAEGGALLRRGFSSRLNPGSPRRTRRTRRPWSGRAGPPATCRTRSRRGPS